MLFKNRIYLPDCNDLKLTVTRQAHDSKVAGHFGRDKTMELLTRNYYWPNLDDWVRTYAKTCDACQRNKTARHKKYGRLQPLEVPYRPWEYISMDFITDLPKVNGYHQIWVIGDRLTKMAHFIPLKNRQAHTLAIAFIREIWRLHGLPMGVVSIRVTIFTSKLWSEVLRLFDIVVRRKVVMSSVVITSGSRRPLLAGDTFEHACGFTTIPLLNRLSI